MSDTKLRIRNEQPGDRDQVRTVTQAAFDRFEEADLIDELRAEGAVLLSLVAEIDGRVVGHILFSRMEVETPQGNVRAVSLAPMAVLPGFQRQQVGSQLVRRGIDELKMRGERMILVLGHKEYYPRFGFSTEMSRNLQSPFPPEAFMALELLEGALKGIHGVVRYPSAFGL
jgi:putative acetyltransferase